MATIGYRFDGDYYSTSPHGEQELLEAVADAIRTDADTDPELTTEEERNEAYSMSFDGTNVVDMSFWDNMMAIMQQSPYEVSIDRIDSDTATDEEREALEYCP